MIKKEYDVVVAGGGMSGTCAAIAAARNDMSVLLIDQNGYLGGTLTANGVGPMMTFFAGEKQVIQGIGEEIVKRLKERGYSPGHVYDSTHYISYVTPFSAEGLKIVLDEMAIDSNVTLLYHTYIIGINKNGNTIKSIDIVNKDGISTINAKIFIDATGDGDLAVEAGIPFTLGRESDNATQPLTMNMKVYGVDTSKLKKTVLQNPKKFPRLNRDIEVMKKVEALSFVGFEEEFKRAKELGEITIPREDVLFFETSTPGEYIINTTRIINENGASALGLTNAEIIGRKQCEELYKFLIKYVPGFENSKIAYTGPSVGVRGSRQIQGVYKLTGEDLLEQKRFNSVIAHSGYPIDIHNPKGEGTLSVHVNKQEESKEAKFDRSTFDSYYSIPYEIMITKEIQNLIVTGRCVSASFEAQAAIRTTPTMTALGQAAGTAAALAIQTNQSVNKIDIKNLQNLLIAQGSYIEKK
ncbi:dihydrolipoamide dehydrogenase [Faecalicoccus pleomorphus]|uniref:Dihydrolipoamide dehydrogenase n=1 Tax=Faecalicoccus pleomorphus TaxID=1323 RepID=A0A380LPK5_9FIRM|nr:FAD-dependent oxidoreductase [Faecalicoccus pleomorphus]SUO04520.1 dihydrolipoamide dehydrogenase [Faecalicoccus pleomorphus]